MIHCYAHEIKYIETHFLATCAQLETKRFCLFFLHVFKYLVSTVCIFPIILRKYFTIQSPLSCCLRFSIMPGVSTKVTLSRSLWGISMPISFSRKFCPNFSKGEKERELSAAITMPSTERIFSPCIITVNSEVVGSAPEAERRKGSIMHQRN